MSELVAGTQTDAGVVPVGEPGRAADAIRDDPLEPYRRWATAFFMILALIGIIGTAYALGGTPEPVVFWGLLASVVLFVSTLLVVVAALRHPESWAVHAIAPICYVIIAAAAIRVVSALTQSNLTVPLDGIGAMMVLTRDHRLEHLPASTDRTRPLVWLAVGAIVVAQVLPHIPDSIVDRAPFGLQAQSLHLEVVIDCTAAGEPDGEIPVRTAWSWREREVFSPPIDGLVVLWNMTTSGAGDASAGAVANSPAIMSHPAMWGGSGYPASVLTEPLDESGPSREFGINIRQAGLLDGSVVFGLRPADSTATHGSLEVWAAYAHGDRWLHRGETTVCSW